MSYDNYPPGVTGAEYQIAGADREVDEEVYCDNCEQTVTATVEYYGPNSWWTCPECNADHESEDDGIDFPDPPEPEYDD